MSEYSWNIKTRGPVVRYLYRQGLLPLIVWETKFASQYPVEAFERDIEALETEDLETILDRWLRGNNIIGFAPAILHTVKVIQKAQKAERRKREAA
jgi:hypothetical protein